jgi:hypothetical protein
MKSKLAACAMVTMIASSMAFAFSAFAQATGEGNNRTVLIQNAPATNMPGNIASPSTAVVGTTANRQLSYGTAGRLTNDQSATSSQEVAAQGPARWFESEARGDNTSARSVGMAKTPPCLSARHYYSASVVNSVPSSCFLANSGPAPLGVAP